MQHIVTKPITGVIFIVDNDAQLLHSLKQYLELENYLIFGAENPVEAITKLRFLIKAGIPHLIITDVNMPLDGQRLIDCLAEDEELRHIPILPISGGSKTHISGKKIFPKPFDLGDLSKKINSLVSEKKIA